MGHSCRVTGEAEAVGRCGSAPRKPTSAKAPLLTPQARAEDRNLAPHPLGPACLSTFTGGSQSYIKDSGVYRRRQGPERRSWNHPSPLSILSYQPCDKWYYLAVSSQSL